MLVNASAGCCCARRGRLLIPSKRLSFIGVWGSFACFITSWSWSWSIVSTVCCWRRLLILEFLKLEEDDQNATPILVKTCQAPSGKCVPGLLVIHIGLKVLFYFSRSQQGTSHKGWDWVHVLTGQTLSHDNLFRLLNFTVSSDCVYWGPTPSGVFRVLLSHWLIFRWKRLFLFAWWQRAEGRWFRNWIWKQLVTESKGSGKNNRRKRSSGLTGLASRELLWLITGNKSWFACTKNRQCSFFLHNVTWGCRVCTIVLHFKHWVCTIHVNV